MHGATNGADFLFIKPFFDATRCRQQCQVVVGSPRRPQARSTFRLPEGREKFIPATIFTKLLIRQLVRNAGAMSGAEAWEDPEEVALLPKHSFYEVA